MHHANSSLVGARAAELNIANMSWGEWMRGIRGLSVHEQPWPTRDSARRAAVDYIGWYNGTRLHSALGYRSPAQFEEDNKIKKVA